MDTFGLYRTLPYFIIILSIFTEAIEFSTVLITRNGRIKCSGSLQGLHTVITAASCIKSGRISQYKVLLKTKQTEGWDVQFRSFPSGYDGTLSHNIGLLRLKRRAVYNGHQVQIEGRLATTVYDSYILPKKNGRCKIIDKQGDQDFNAAVYPAKLCSRLSGQEVSNSQICVKMVGPLRKSCPTNIGGPVVCRVNNGMWVQVGIHVSKSCWKKYMISPRISAYREWTRRAQPLSRRIEIGEEEQPEIPEIPETPDNTDNIDESENSTNIDDNDTNGGIDAVISDTTTTTSKTTDAIDFLAHTTTEPIVPCAVDEYTCTDGTCIPQSQVCDGIAQCPCGGEDESSCGCDLAGTEFVTGFLNNISPINPILYVTAPDGANVNVSIPTSNYSESMYVTDTVKWSLENVTVLIDDTNINKGVHIKSDKLITVVAANSREFSFTTVDGNIVYPINCLSKSYTVELQYHRFYKASQFAIIGVYPNTTVTRLSRQGRSETFTLGFLETFFLQGKDLRGMRITSSNDVVVMSGSECGYVPTTSSMSCDHMVTQVPSNLNYGTSYIVSPQKPRIGYMYRVRAAVDNTNITIRYNNGTVFEEATINVITEFVRTVLDGTAFSIVGDSGIMVTEYALDANFDGIGLGDPSMVILQSLNHFDSKYEFVIPDHFLRVGLTITISTCYDATGLRLNGELLESYGNTRVVTEAASYNVIYIDLVSKWETEEYAVLTHVDENVNFGAFMYGMRVEGAFAWRIGGKI
ncbi:Carboxypeptidase N [Mactra antiquata]